MPRSKTTVYLEPAVLQATKVEAARSGRHEYEVVEAALRAYLGFEIAEGSWARSDLSEDEALRLAYDETHAARH
jgi:hypothetical protein